MFKGGFLVAIGQRLYLRSVSIKNLYNNNATACVIEDKTTFVNNLQMLAFFLELVFRKYVDFFSKRGCII